MYNRHLIYQHIYLMKV